MYEKRQQSDFHFGSLFGRALSTTHASCPHRRGSDPPHPAHDPSRMQKDDPQHRDSGVSLEERPGGWQQPCPASIISAPHSSQAFRRKNLLCTEI